MAKIEPPGEYAAVVAARCILAPQLILRRVRRTVESWEFVIVDHSSRVLTGPFGPGSVRHELKSPSVGVHLVSNGADSGAPLDCQLPAWHRDVLDQ